MGELAEIARMGVSTLHHQFRALTAMSPLQYQKQLRLQRARERMLMDGMDATSAAYEVGYESVSQFNREYSRFFGQPPMRDIKTLRATSVVAANGGDDGTRTRDLCRDSLGIHVLSATYILAGAAKSLKGTVGTVPCG
jgi:AraC-like DNA-binding protein